MKKAVLPTLLVVLLALVASDAAAKKIGKGAVEIAASGSFAHNSYSRDGDDAGSTTDLNLAVGTNRSVSDLVAIGGAFTFVHQSVDPAGSGSVSAGAMGISANVVWNFASQSSVVPFLALGVGALAWTGDGYDDASTTILLPTLEFGIRSFLTETAALNLALSYARQKNARGVDDYDANSFALSLGLSIFPRGLTPLE